MRHRLAILVTVGTAALAFWYVRSTNEKEPPSVVELASDAAPEPRKDAQPRPDLGRFAHRHPRLRPSTKKPRGQGIGLVARGQVWPFWVEVDQTHVYWNTGDGRLRRAPKTGGQPEELLRTHTTTFKIDDEHIYYTADYLGRIPKAGGQQTKIDAKRDALNVVLFGDRLFYNEFKGRAVFSIDTGGKGFRVLQTTRKGPADLATDGRHVYFVTYSRYGKVYRVPVRGGPGQVLAGGQPKPTGISIDATHVYWSLEGDGTIRRTRKRGGRIETVVRGQDNHDTLVGDDRALYWGSWDRGAEGHSLRRLDKASGTVSTLITNLSGPSGLALDETHVYVANKGAWTVIRTLR